MVTICMTQYEYDSRRKKRLVLRFVGLAAMILFNIGCMVVSGDSTSGSASGAPFFFFVLSQIGAVMFILSFFFPKLPRLNRIRVGKDRTAVCARCRSELRSIGKKQIFIIDGKQYCDVCTVKLESARTVPVQTASVGTRTADPTKQAPSPVIPIDPSTLQPRPADIPAGLELTPDEFSMRLTAIRQDVLRGLFFDNDPKRLRPIAEEMLAARDLCCTELLWLIHETDFRIQLCKYHEPEDLTGKIPELTESKALLRTYVLRRLTGNDFYAFVRKDGTCSDRKRLSFYTHKSKVNAVIALLADRAENYTVRTVNPSALRDAVGEWISAGYETFTVDGQPDVFRLSEPEALPRPDAPRVEAQPAQTRAETPDEPHPDDIPDSLLFMPNEM